MKLTLKYNYYEDSVKGNKELYIASLLIIPLLTFLWDFSALYGMGLFITLIAAFSLFNFNIALVFFTSSLFLNVLIQYSTPSEFFSFILAGSFLVTYRFKAAELNNKILPFYLIFFLSVIPSFLNYTQVLNVILALKLLAFLLVFIVIGAAITDFRKIKLILNAFLIFSVLNALHVIVMAVLTNRRVFGFAGIMFVDYAGIALAIALSFFLYFRRMRWLYFTGFIITITALLLTQTRNAWITSGIIILLILIKFFISGKKNSSESINKYLLIVVLFIASLAAGFQALTFNPKTFERVQAVNQEKQRGIDDFEINTVVTRVLIWHTAWNAFKANPYTGIGLYNFQFVSGNYYTINTSLYKEYVEGLSPHQSFLEILTETGILGFSGFLLFLGAILFYAAKNVRLSKNTEEKFYSTLVFWLSVFILLSMMMTDAWLWGHGLMLWGIVVGMVISLQNHFKRQGIQTEQVD